MRPLFNFWRNTHLSFSIFIKSIGIDFWRMSENIWFWGEAKITFLTFPECFLIPIFFSNLNSNCSNLSDMRNLQKQVKKAFCYQKLFWPFTVWINCSSDLKMFANSRPAASNFKSFSRSLEQFFLTVGQNNFGNKIPFRFVEGIIFSFFSFLKCWKVQLLWLWFQWVESQVKMII